MKKLIVILLAVLILAVSLAACTPNNNGDNNESSGNATSAPATTKNEGMITDTGTGTNIIDRIESDMVGTDSSATK